MDEHGYLDYNYYLNYLIYGDRKPEVARRSSQLLAKNNAELARLQQQYGHGAEGLEEEEDNYVPSDLEEDEPYQANPLAPPIMAQQHSKREAATPTTSRTDDSKKTPKTRRGVVTGNGNKPLLSAKDLRTARNFGL